MPFRCRSKSAQTKSRSAEDILKELFRSEVAPTEDLALARYAPLYKELLTYMEQLGGRRQAANQFFLTLNTAVIGALGYAYTNPKLARGTLKPVFIVAGTFGCVLACQWWRLIRSHEARFKADFEILHTLEERLPARIFKVEQSLFFAVDESKKRIPYVSLMVIERSVSAVFIVLYFLLACYGLLAP